MRFLSIKPYKDIETAIKNYRNDCYLNLEVKVKLHNDFRKDERALIDGAILCKVFKTFYSQYDNLIKKYKIKHVGHTFWDGTTWRMKYNNSNYSFEIHSHNFVSSERYLQDIFGDKECDKIDISYYSDYLNQYLAELLDELKNEAPVDRYSEIRDHIQKICDSD